MYFVNLTLLQFAGILGTVGAGVIALYLWDRSRRRAVVPTLRFWTASARAAEVKHRKRIQQPWSLLLQLVGIGLLLLALAQVRLGSPASAARDHVLILDTSAWMAARSEDRTLMERARAMARAYVRAVPSSDRVMLVRADALATPATAFESGRDALERAIAASRPAATALNLDQAVEFAHQAQRLQGGRAGEIVYVGFRRTAHPPQRADGMRILPVEANVANCGLRQIGMRRSAADPDVWEILVAVQNYTPEPRRVTVALAFGGSPAGTRELLVPARRAESAAFRYRQRGAGWLEARVTPRDDFDGNHRVVIEVPARRNLRVLVYTDEPDLLRPVFAANPEVEAVFLPPAQYRRSADTDIVVLDRFSPPAPPAQGAIWIEPPSGSPVRTVGTASGVALTRWRSDHPLGAGLRTRDLRLDSVHLLQPASGDTVIAECENGAVAVARDGNPKTVVLGFHPVRTPMRFELATPLLFANMLRWMHPDTFRRWELNAGSAGMVNVELDDAGADVRVVNEAGAPLPHSRQGRSLRFFAGTPGKVRVVAGENESVHSLVLPELAEQSWTAPRDVRRGLPGFAGFGPQYLELWPWLAAAGLVVLLIEWLMFGRSRAMLRIHPASGPPSIRRKRRRVRSALASVRSLL